MPGEVTLSDFGQWFRQGSSASWAARDISLKVQAGEFLAVVGPSGCGKSTLLHAISGLRRPSHGAVFIDEEPVTGIRRDVGYLFQRDALLPWRTVLENVVLPLTYRGVRKREALGRAQEWLRRVKLAPFQDHYPHQLSGGMRKRAALASAFVYEPQVILMDEPFSALDVQTRMLMENELLDIWTERRPTVVFVTHDLEEAIGLADRVLVLTAGPGRIKADYEIDLARPRVLTEVRFAPGFQELYRALWQDLKGEVMTAYAEDTAGEDVAGGTPDPS
jgi:NitT/TauT family transport system ATP-binding protein